MNKNIILSNEFSDHWIGKPPVRIVSLVPSLTELLYFFDLDENVVGITRFCELPKIKDPKPANIGGTKDPVFDRIKILEPDVIFAAKEENNLSDVEKLSALCPVIVTDIKTIEDNINVINHSGRLFQKIPLAEEVASRLLQEYKVVPAAQSNAIYLIWKEPLMTVGGDSYIHNMMGYAGFKNLYGNSGRYPNISIEEIVSLDPEYILLSSEPYPFKQKHVSEFQTIFPDTKIVLVDGQMFSWYGIRPLYAKEYFKSIL